MGRTQKFYRDVIIIGTILILIVAIVFGNFIPKLLSALSPMIFALALFYIFKPLVNLFHRKLSVTLSVILTFLIAIIIFLGFLGAIIPAVYQSIKALAIFFYSTTPEEFLDMINSIPFFNDHFDTSILGVFFNNLYNMAIHSLSSILTYTTSFIQTIKHLLASLIISIMGILMAFYLLRDSVDSAIGKIQLFIKSIFPSKVSHFILKVARLTDDSIKRFLIGKLLTSAILGIVIFFISLIINLFTSIDIPYLPLLALLMAFGNLIPYIGSILTAIPCLLLCLIQGYPEALAFLAIVLAVQAIDNMIITPKILGDYVGIQPFWILVGITVVGGLTGSIIGMILSVPFIAVIISLAEEKMNTYLEKVQETEKNSSSDKAQN